MKILLLLLCSTLGLHAAQIDDDVRLWFQQGTNAFVNKTVLSQSNSLATTTAQDPTNGVWVISMVTGSDATTTGQTLVDVAGLTFAAAANASYEIEAVLRVSTTAVTTGCQYGINHTGTGSPSVNAIVQGSSNATLNASCVIGALNTASTTAFLTTSAQSGIIVIKGIVVSGTGLGAITIRHLKVTSGTSTVKIGSVLKVRKLL